MPSDLSDIIRLRPLSGNESEICGIFTLLEKKLPWLNFHYQKQKRYRIIKTVEAGLIAREMLDRGEIKRLAILCSPQLCDQWQQELKQKFHIDAVVIRSGTVGKLERELPSGDSHVFSYYPHIIVSLDYAKRDRRRASFLTHCPDLVIVHKNLIIGKADYLGCITHAINGTENHIHIVASIPPSLSISQYVKKIKGSSSHHWNHTLTSNLDKFYWQEGYGVFSLGSKQLETAVNYVKNQKIHHSQGTVIAALERNYNAPDTS